MGFWQGLVESYDANFEALQEEYPLSTTTISNNADIILITIREGGEFLKAKTDKAKNISNSIAIPVTKESLTKRTGGDQPHLIFDSYKYINKGKYLPRLDKFANSEFADQFVKSINDYLKRNTLERDLIESKIPINEIKIEKNGKDKELYKDLTILFEVEIIENPNTKPWKDSNFFKCCNKFLASMISDKDGDLDYITGEIQEKIENHPKVLARKLISKKEDGFIKFSGRFLTAEQAFAVGNDSSLKAHRFLNFLIKDRGIKLDTQVIVTYVVKSSEKLPNPFSDSKDLFDVFFSFSSDNSAINLRADTGSDYARALRKALNGYSSKEDLDILRKHERIAIIVFDAATTGRLSITFYKELDKEDYLEKIASWHDTCKWHQIYFGEDKKCHKYIGTPSVDNIIKAIYGNPRSAKDDSYKKIKKLARERLLHCIFDGEKISKDYVNGAVRRASNPVVIIEQAKEEKKSYKESYKEKYEKFYEPLLATTCSLVKKFFKQKGKEYKLAIEYERKDRDYLYGRLLGTADKLEEYVLSNEQKNRSTNAVRYQNAFSQHPFKTWKIIEESLNPYIQKLRGKKILSQNEMEKIKSLFQAGDFENDTPLNGSYLLGYSLERLEIDQLVSELNSKKHNNKEGE